ncbi:TetR/AcrR family transcriptional regulator [Novosphingobium sp.]|uniref:TetR/AcrR family transcriptional regulator n=1 Tax=Novosphingobium sp. TaxID=1874826 RepID=UPI00262962B5|nr:TetR/AcrR family transcriptional regulator [Novosphingobium sp.]
MIAPSSVPSSETRGRRSSAEIDQRVAASAKSLFARKGYSETTFREIADQAGVHEPALYRRFPSKAALFDAVVLKPIAEVIEEYIATIDKADAVSPLSAEERVRRFVPPLYRLMVSERQSVLALICVSEFHPEEFEQSQNFLAMIGRLVERVAPHVTLDLDAKPALFSAFGLVLGVSLLSGSTNVGEGQYLSDPQRVVEELVTFTLRGVSMRGQQPVVSDVAKSDLIERLLDRVADAERRAIRAELELEILKGV